MVDSVRNFCARLCFCRAVSEPEITELASGGEVEGDGGGGEGITHRTVAVNGIDMHVAEKGEGPVVLLVHGFPELWYTWRHQIHRLAARGFRAVAPDLRGFGDTEAPPDVSSYSMFHLVGDLVGLIDFLGQEQVITVSDGFLGVRLFRF